MEKELIPKKIHYCWFGKSDMPEFVKYCISTWKEKCPDYEIYEWNETNIDLNMFDYTKEAYYAKKYAFVSDVIRLYVLYNFGGIYMDTDVEVIRSLDSLLINHGFTGFETNTEIPTGIIAAEKNNLFILDQLNFYKDKHFINENGIYNLSTNVQYITQLSLEKHNLILNGQLQELKYGMMIYPTDYFCPKDYLSGKINITDNTYAIHHFDGSWLTKTSKFKNKIRQNIINIFGYKFYNYIHYIYNMIRANNK